MWILVCKDESGAWERLSSKLRFAEPPKSFAFIAIRDFAHLDLSWSDATAPASKRSFGDMQSQAELGTE
jgi:hypothetical protein